MYLLKQTSHGSFLPKLVYFKCKYNTKVYCDYRVSQSAHFRANFFSVIFLHWLILGADDVKWLCNPLPLKQYFSLQDFDHSFKDLDLVLAELARYAEEFFWELVMIGYGNLTYPENKNSFNQLMKLTSRFLTNDWFYEFQILCFNYVRI